MSRTFVIVVCCSFLAGLVWSPPGEFWQWVNGSPWCSTFYTIYTSVFICVFCSLCLAVSYGLHKLIDVVEKKLGISWR